MTTVKTEIFMNIKNGVQYVFETLYAGGQRFVYKINGRMVNPEIWFELKQVVPFVNELKQVK